MKKLKNVPKWLRIVLPIAIIGVWLVGAGIGGPYFGKISEVSSVDLTAFLPENAEATRVSKESQNFLSSDTVSAVVVFEATDGGISAADQQAIEAVRNKMTQRLNGVAWRCGASSAVGGQASCACDGSN